MKFLAQIEEALFGETDRMGMYAIQMDHPGLLPSLKKRKTTKADRSLFINDKDAEKQYITGTIDVSGKTKKNKKSKSTVEDKIEKRLGLL